MLTVTQGIPPKLAVPRPLLRSPFSITDGLLATPSLENVATAAIAVDNEITVPPGIDVIDRVEIGGIIYIPYPPATYSPPPSNIVYTPPKYTFWYNPSTRKITLNGTNRTGQTAYIFKATTPQKTDRLLNTHPLFKRWATGAIAYQSKLGEYPVISSISFQCYKSELETLLQLLDPANAIAINGHTYYPTGKTISETPHKRIAKVTCGFRSQFRDHPTRSPMDRQVKIYNRDPATLFVNNPLYVNNPEATAPYVLTEFGTGLYSMTPFYKASEVAKAVGITYSGVEIKVWGEASGVTTLRKILSSDRLETAQCFVRYDKDKVEVVKWDDVATHTISESEVKGESQPDYQYKGEGHAISGVPLLRELNYVRLKWDSFPLRSFALSLPGQQGGSNETLTKVSGDDAPTYPPQDFLEKLRSPSQCFDNGGPTKKQVTTKTRNGKPIEETEETWGFAYTSLDTYSWYPNLVDAKSNGFYFAYQNQYPGNFWILVRSVTKSYSYSYEGYLESVTTSTKELTRILKESDSLEAINAYAWYNTIGTPRNIKEDYEARLHALSYYAYGFDSFSTTYSARSADAIANPAIANDIFTSLSWQPWKIYTSKEYFTNTPMSQYYQDIRKPDNAEQNWYPPRFVELRESYVNSVYVVNDPRSTRKEKKPPLVFGKAATQYDRVDILDEKTYKITSVVAGQRGEGLTQTAIDESSSMRDGRPSVIDRLQTFDGLPSNPRGEPNFISGFGRKIMVTTEGLSPSGVEMESISFPDCRSLDDATNALQTKLLRENLDALTCTIQLNHARDFREGDRVIYGGKPWRILAITNNQEITADGILRQRSYTLDLGYDYGNIPLTIQEINAI